MILQKQHFQFTSKDRQWLSVWLEQEGRYPTVEHKLIRGVAVTQSLQEGRYKSTQTAQESCDTSHWKMLKSMFASYRIFKSDMHSLWGDLYTSVVCHTSEFYLLIIFGHTLRAALIANDELDLSKCSVKILGYCSKTILIFICIHGWQHSLLGWASDPYAARLLQRSRVLSTLSCFLHVFPFYLSYLSFLV